MTDDAGHFAPRPRRPRSSPLEVANTRAELERIVERTRVVADAGRSGFAEGAASYAIASMAVIRLAAVLERAEAAPLAARLSEDERVALRATRNIASHAGYPALNDDLFWEAVTRRVPAIVERMLAALDAS